jgi:glucose/arabinose dehydrogenase
MIINICFYREIHMPCRWGLLLLALVVQGALASQPQIIQSEKHAFRIVPLVQGLEHPWSMAWLPDGRILVTEREGRLRVVSRDFRMEPRPVGGVPEVVTGGQSGLFDVAVHPRYADNGWVYLVYMGPGLGGSGIEVMRAKLEGATLTQQQVIFRAAPKLNSRLNLGGRIAFDRQNHLYVSIGDRFQQERSQQPDDDSGSVARLLDDGRIPPDNPYLKQANARPGKFTLGNRNIQGMAMHPQSGALWSHEHGPQGGDEVNVIRAGRNYGWPVITYGANYGTGTKIGEGTHRAGMEQPLWKWVPSIAPSGMTFYDGERFPQWRGNILLGALRGQMLVRLELDGETVVREERMMPNAIGRIRDVRVGPDGYVYLLTDDDRGMLSRLEPVR